MNGQPIPDTGVTPAQFHVRPGVSDWRVTSWGPQTCIRTASLREGGEIVKAIVAVATTHGLEPDIDLRPEAVVVRIPYRGGDRIPAAGPALAAAISEAATELGLVADLDLISTVDIAVAGHASIDSRPFWVATLGYETYGDTDAIDPLRRGPQLSFQSLDRQGRGRTHIDVSVPADQAQARVDAALAAGGRLVDGSHAPDWWTVASPDNHGIDIAAWNDTWG